MASKTKVTPQKEVMLEKEGRETPPGSPLLDLSDAAVKKLIRSAKKRGYVTHDQINALLSSEEVKSEQIEDILSEVSVHHDALEFPNGKIILLARLCEGQHATVLQLPASPRATNEAERQKRGSLVS